MQGSTAPAPARPPAAGSKAGAIASLVALPGWPWVWAAVGLWVWRAATVGLSGASLHVDEAQYWLWSRDLQWGYFSKPPGVAALIATSVALFGDGVLGVKALTMACWIAAAVPIAAIAHDAGGRRAAWVVAGIWWASPLCGLLGLAATTDAPLVLAWSLALRALWLGCRRPGSLPWAAMALAVAAGALSKYPMLLLLPGAAWFGWRYGRRGSLGALLWVGAAGLAALVPNLAWNAAQDWPTIAHIVDSTGAPAAPFGASLALRRTAEFLLAQLALIGPLALALAAVGSARPSPMPGHLRPTVDALALSTGLPLLAVVLAQAWRGRVEVNWVAPLHLGAALWLGLRCHGLATVRVAGTLGAQALAVSVLALLPAAIDAQRPGQWPPAALDPWARMRGWPEVRQALLPHLRAVPGSSLVLGESRHVLALAAYAFRRDGVRVAAPDFDGHPDHHFELACRWPGRLPPGASLWLLTTEDPGPGWRQVLAGWTVVQRVDLPVARERHLRLVLSRAWPLPAVPTSAPATGRAGCP